MTENTIISAEVTYSDGSKATFNGEPLDLSTIPTQSSDQQDAATPADEAAQGGESETPNDTVAADAEQGDEVADRNTA